MDSAQIEKWAAEAGFTPYISCNTVQGSAESLTRFAELVAAAELERCAQLCDAVAAPYQAAGASVAIECAAAIRNTASRSGESP